MDTASRPRASRRRLDAFPDRWATLNIEMDEDAKVQKHSLRRTRHIGGLLWKRQATALPHCLLEVEDGTKYGSARPVLTVWTQAIANLETWLQQRRTEPIGHLC
jgi:hypothetical protein